MKNELGELDDTNAAPAVPGKGAEARAAEAKRQREEHKKNLQRMKAAGKKRKGGFDRSKLNANFMANTKSAKDKVSGWAFDFSNPDAGGADAGPKIDPAMAGDEATLQKVIQESLKDGQTEDSVVESKPKG